MADQRLLHIKKQKKAQKPAFFRRNFKKNKRTRVNGKWRAPRGLHNKLRRRRRGIGQWVMPGYRMPARVRGLTVDGLLPVVVENTQQMGALDSAIHAVILKSSTGEKKKVLMIQEALKKNIRILNMRDASAFLKACEEKRAQKPVKEKEKRVGEKKEEKKEEKEEEKPSEKTIEEIAKDHTKEEQQQKHKILTKKE